MLAVPLLSNNGERWLAHDRCRGELKRKPTLTSVLADTAQLCHRSARFGRNTIRDQVAGSRRRSNALVSTTMRGRDRGVFLHHNNRIEDHSRLQARCAIGKEHVIPCRQHICTRSPALGRSAAQTPWSLPSSSRPGAARIRQQDPPLTSGCSDHTHTATLPPGHAGRRSRATGSS